MLTAVVPVFNCLSELRVMLSSLVDSSAVLSEIVLVDDKSHTPTKEFINTLDVDSSKDIRLIKTRNPNHLWTNGSWNIGTKLATQKYIAVLNSDIILFKDWDAYLIETLKEATIACPFEKRGDKIFDLYDIHKEVHPGMIKGACFMFKKKDRDKLFEIPQTLTHWCGDHYLADQAAKLDGVKFNKSAIIAHKPSSSSKLVDEDVYRKVTKQDVLNYQKLSKRNMKPILEAVFSKSPEGEAL